MFILIFTLSKYLWEDLVINYQQVRLFEVSTMFVKLILHANTLICGNTLYIFGKQKVGRTNPWIFLASVY